MSAKTPANVSKPSNVNAKTPSQLLGEKMARVEARQRVQTARILVREASKLKISVPALCQQRCIQARNNILATVSFGKPLSSQMNANTQKIDGVEMILAQMASQGKVAWPAEFVNAIVETLALLQK